MSISVPPSALPPSSPGLLAQPPSASGQGEEGVPSDANMLMALAEMHKMGRIKPQKPKAR